MEKLTRLILALDMVDCTEAFRIAKAAASSLDAIKLNWPFILACEPKSIKPASRIRPVICDLKLADIPNTTRLIATKALELGAEAVIAHGFAGRDSLEAAVAATNGAVYVVTEMSHPGGAEFTAPIAERLARLAVEVKARGIIAPATRPERIRHLRKLVGSLEILAPGAGAQGGSAGEAIRAGADYIIAGRAIYEAEDPARAAAALAGEIRAAVSGEA